MPVGGPSSHMAGLRRLDSAGERSHRQLIDCIRSKDTDALIDAIDNGSEFRSTADRLNLLEIVVAVLSCEICYL